MPILTNGVERLYDALSALMWPEMILKSGNRTSESLLPVKEELSSEESDYELEYEVLSVSLTSEQQWVSATSLDAGGSVPHGNLKTGCENEDGIKPNKEFEPSTSSTAF
ncbi:hypothetical protein Ahy_Scaffold1g107233 isoform B [Arachis hypogaea]|uniref:Uncharacterized protein n=1 Tax=Arachis hypogaea TaxID=3818 RepID=A0A444WUW9_ARAHY|nr:hypothetical protein Ahy_Scaffold1g107233 isoform B [Arachis hypogaea]